MPRFPPDTRDVVVVTSRQAGTDRRSFELEEESADEARLPDLGEIRHEKELVDSMKALGFRLTMVGGGAGGDELRRFYFRPS